MSNSDAEGLISVQILADEYRKDGNQYISISKAFPSKVSFHRLNINEDGYIVCKKDDGTARYFRPSRKQTPEYHFYLHLCLSWFPATVQDIFRGYPEYQDLFHSKKGGIFS